MELAVADGGDAPLIRVGVVPYLLGNASARHFYVSVETLLGIVTAGPRLRRDFLLGLPSADGATVAIRGGAKDENDLWSGWSDESSLVVSDFSTDNTRQSSIASVANADVLVEDPSISFPDLAQGSGTMRVWRTIVTETFQDEVRRGVRECVRAAFNVKIDDADAEQVDMLQRLYETTRGPVKPFLFDFFNPHTRENKRYTVRFADDSFRDSLPHDRVDKSDLDFKLIEVVAGSVGGDLV